MGGLVGMRQGRLIATGAMLLFCLFALWQSLLLPLTDRLGPGPGFFPFWLSLIGSLLAIALLVTTWREPTEPQIETPRILPHGPGGRRWLAIVGLIAAVTIAMEVVGFRLAMLVFNAALVAALGERRWWLIALFAVLGSFGVYYVFTTWLDVILPTGKLGF
ncbi:tripartite tricarboxylate transporter TctB family protein [Reyranella sp.]|uniref:tripartite tricarboxylate transporter TctB family protein n=2 Tax=Reyranella sp. TaxID=1929291 RepID=UPI003D0ACC6C